MTRLKFSCAAAILAALAAIPSQAQARRHHARLRAALPISYIHNYGPGVEPGTFAYYDGPSTNFCAQGSATYSGQDRRRYPCF